MALPTIHGEGRIVGQPELRHTKSGVPVLQFRMAANRRKYNEQTQAWENVGECWLNAAIWDTQGERNDGSLNDKDLVSFDGELETRSFERKDGTKGLSVDVRISRIGKIAPPTAGGGGGQQSYGGQSQAAGGAWGSDDSEPPF